MWHIPFSKHTLFAIKEKHSLTIINLESFVQKEFDEEIIPNLRYVYTKSEVEKIIKATKTSYNFV